MTIHYPDRVTRVTDFTVRAFVGTFMLFVSSLKSPEAVFIPSTTSSIKQSLNILAVS